MNLGLREYDTVKQVTGERVTQVGNIWMVQDTVKCREFVSKCDDGGGVSVDKPPPHRLLLQLLLERERVEDLRVSELAAFFASAVLFLAGLNSKVAVEVMPIAEPARDTWAGPLDKRVTSLVWANADERVVDHAGGKEDGGPWGQAADKAELPKNDMAPVDRRVFPKRGEDVPATRDPAVWMSGGEVTRVRTTKFEGERGKDTGGGRIQEVWVSLQEQRLFVPESVESRRAERLQEP